MFKCWIACCYCRVFFFFWSNNAHSAIHPSMTVVVIVTGRRKWSKGKPNGSGTVRWLCGFAFLVLSGWVLFHTAGQLSIQVGNKNTVMDEKGFQNSLEAASFFFKCKNADYLLSHYHHCSLFHNWHQPRLCSCSERYCWLQ